ncbi:MAG: NADH-quinone oxidoreductase subunit K [Chloroflexi bacterium]|nr:NADH-quinone oxidoreductase subunit K [Chloroflexota bacterium]
MTDPQIILVGVMGLVGVGVYGLLISRNLIKVIVALQILVKGAMLAMIAAGAASGRVNLGQSLAVTVIVADTVVAVIGLALAIQIKRRVGTLDVKDLGMLKK